MRKLLIIAISVTSFSINSQNYQERITIEESFDIKDQENKSLIIKNIYGNINIEGYSGPKVILKVEKIISADDKQSIKQGNEEVSMFYSNENNKLIIHPKSPYFYYDSNFKIHFKDDTPKKKYNFRVNLTLKIPRKMNVDVRNISKGQITIKNIDAQLISATNISGDLFLKNISGQTNAKTINGKIEISYTSNPQKKSSYQSINGDINIIYQKDLNANILFENKMGNAEFFCDFDVVSQKSITTKTKIEGDSDTPYYLYTTNPVIQVGKGDVEYSFKTTNGDIYIKDVTKTK